MRLNNLLPRCLVCGSKGTVPHCLGCSLCESLQVLHGRSFEACEALWWSHLPCGENGSRLWRQMHGQGRTDSGPWSARAKVQRAPPNLLAERLPWYQSQRLCGNYRAYGQGPGIKGSSGSASDYHRIRRCRSAEAVL